MAKMITIESTDTNRGKILVNTENIVSVMPGDSAAAGGNVATKCIIFQNFDLSTDFSGIELTIAGGTGTQAANAIISAMVANPGGQHAAVKFPDGVTVSDILAI